VASELGHHTRRREEGEVRSATSAYFCLLRCAVCLAPTPLAAAAQHFVVDAEHVLRPDDIADLARHGVEVQRVLPDHRYLVRAASADLLEGDVRIARVDSYTASRKIARSAYHAAARGNAFTTVRLVFPNEVSFDDAQRA